MRMMRVSVRPPRYAATSPNASPIARATTVLATPTMRLIRRP